VRGPAPQARLRRARLREPDGRLHVARATARAGALGGAPPGDGARGRSVRRAAHGRCADPVDRRARWIAQASTLSKTVAPGLRVGWLLLPPWLRDAVVRLKQAADLHTSSLAQETARHYLASGRLPARLAIVRAEYARRRDALAEALQSGFGDRLALQVPEGGMFLWGRFTDGTDTRALLPHALERGTMFVPGDAFFVDAADAASLRLNFSAAPPDRLREGARRLRDAHAALHARAAAA
jgi:2-aminoadipate transaminase